MRTYSELIKIPSFEERFKYLYLGQTIGDDTFGFDRAFNQMFYHSGEWKVIRRKIIVRDTLGSDCLDLGCGFPIAGNIYVHHMNPISIEDIRFSTEYLLNPEYLICCSFDTHQAIHFGESNLITKTIYEERTPFDTCPWIKNNQKTR